MSNKTRRGGNRKSRKPALKDWVRVIKSQGNGLDNVHMHLIINEATGLVEFESQAHAKEDSDELEPKRVQVFKIHSFEVVNDPNRDPLAKQATNEDNNETDDSVNES